MSGFAVGGVTTHLRDRNNLIASYRNVLVQVRSGALDVATIDRMASAARVLAARVGGPIGALSILEESAEHASGEVRARQRAVITEMMSTGQASVAVVILGSGVGATLLRSVARMVVPGQAGVRVVGSLEEGARALDPNLGVPEDELVALAHHCRREAAEARG